MALLPVKPAVDDLTRFLDPTNNVRILHKVSMKQTISLTGRSRPLHPPEGQAGPQ